MNVLICFKWEKDSNEATITSEGALKWFDTKLKPTDDEAAAIGFARQLIADTNGTLTGVTIGDGDPSWVLARGASRTVSVEDYRPSVDNFVTGAELANAIKATGDFDVVLMGDAQEFSGVAPTAAAILGLPLIAGVTDVAVDLEYSDCLLIHRTTTQAQETLRVHTPALISVTAVGSEKTHPTMRQIMAAKKLPIDRLDAATLAPVAESRVAVKDSRLPEQRRARMIEGGSEQAVGELISILRAKEIL